MKIININAEGDKSSKGITLPVCSLYTFTTPHQTRGKGAGEKLKHNISTRDGKWEVVYSQ
eukprot:9379891-Ditylum_brightwellii.AAC.1